MTMRSIGIYYILGIFVTLVILFGVTTSAAGALSYPVKELGNCGSARDCYTYCQMPEHTPACWSYEKYVLHRAVLAEMTASTEAKMKGAGVTFPIAELGN